MAMSRSRAAISRLAGLASGAPYAVTIAAHITPGSVLHARLSLPVAIVMSAAFAVGGTLLAIDRLRSFRLTGETS